MAKEIFITARKDVTEPYKDRIYKGDVKTYRFDFRAWAEDNNNLTGVDWVVESGQASVSSEAHSSNVATANITATESGRSLIKVQATDGTLVKTAYLDLKIFDPEVFIDDYV